MLRPRRLEPLLPSRCDCLPGTELAGRLARWNAGPRAAEIAPALWLLCGPHGRQLWSARADGRLGAVGMHASADRHRAADRVPDALDSVVSCDPHLGGISLIVLAVRANGTSHSARGRAPGIALEADGAFSRP